MRRRFVYKSRCFCYHFVEELCPFRTETIKGDFRYVQKYHRK